jgi:hypothetical protein
VFVYPRFEKGLTMRNASWICMLIALAMFTIGCGPKPTTPAGVDEAPTTMDVETPADETVTEPAAEEPAMEPAPEEPATEPAAEEPATEPAAEEPATEPAPEEPATEPAPE